MSQIEKTKELHNEGQFEAAIQGYQEILQQDPNNDEAHFGMAHASSRLNQLETALVHAKEAVKLAPSSDRYQQFKGQMLMANQQLDEALKTFKRSLKENPNLFFSYLASGDIYAIKNESEKAKDQYKLALKVHKNGIPAIVKLAKLMLLEGDYDGAENTLQEAELQSPQEPSLKLHLGITRLEQNEEGFAEMYFKKVLDDEPENQVARAYLAISLLESDQQQANNILTEMIKSGTQIPELMVALGLVCSRQNNHIEAINYLKPICQSGLAYPSWLMALARSYAGNRQPNSAKAVLNEVLKRGDNGKALLMLGQIHQVNNEYSTAIKTYKRIKPSDALYHESLLMQAECHYADTDYEQALVKLSDILDAHKNHKTAIKLKINALSQLGQYNQALRTITSLDTKQQTDNFNQLMYLYAGLLLDAKKDYKQAWKCFAKLQHKTPQSVKLLNPEDEKMVQNMTDQSNHANESDLRFVFTDPATGHHDFINWLLQNNITPLIDRFTGNTRPDVLSQKWTVDMLSDMDDTQAHLLRRKYHKHLRQVHQGDHEMVIDFLPFSPLNAAIVKRIFPQAQVLVLSRNFADLRLHDAVFGPFQVYHTNYSKVANQMIAMNPKAKVVDIDEWQNKETMALNNIHQMFGQKVTDFKLAEVTPLDTMLFPYTHWKHYQKLMNP